MKNEIRLALLCLATSAAPVFGQDATPPCGFSNFDQSQKIFTVMNPVAGAVNQQCILTVYPRNEMPSQAQQYPASYLAAGRYAIELTGGGGGGSGGGSTDQGGGGGAAGALPLRTVVNLSPGQYKLTLGTGGEGGSPYGGRTGDGNPSSLTNAATGQLIAGFAGADVWRHQTVAADHGEGGAAQSGGGSGGDGGHGDGKSAEVAESGGQLANANNSAIPGQPGNESIRADQSTAGRIHKRHGGGGGGVSVGSGGDGESANGNVLAGAGDLGGGGGGGRGGENTAEAGNRGGHGLIRLTMLEAAPPVEEQRPVVVPAEAPPRAYAPPDRPRKQDRN